MSHHAHSWCEALQLRVQWDPIAGKFFRDQHGLPGAPSGPSGTNLSSLVNKAQEVGMKSVSFLVSKFLQTCSPPNWGLKHRLVTCDIAAGARKFCYTWNVLLQSRSLTCWPHVWFLENLSVVLFNSKAQSMRLPPVSKTAHARNPPTQAHISYKTEKMSAPPVKQTMFDITLAEGVDLWAACSLQGTQPLQILALSLVLPNLYDNVAKLMGRSVVYFLSCGTNKCSQLISIYSIYLFTTGPSVNCCPSLSASLGCPAKVVSPSLEAMIGTPNRTRPKGFWNFLPKLSTAE
jgi:hypothetical protein